MSDKYASIVPLTGPNYPTWKVQCQMALLKDGLWSLVNGTETLPGDASADRRLKFEQRKDRALAVIVLSIDPSLLYLLGEPSDPVAVWKALSNQFQKKTWANRLALRRRLNSIRLREGQPVQDHIKAMTELFNELAVVGDNIDMDDRVIYLLASLPEPYNVLVTALEASSEVPKIEDVIERLLHEEQKLKDRYGTRTGKAKEDALTIKHKKGPQCYHCKRFGHIRRNCKEYEKSQARSEKSQKSVPQRDGTHKVNSVKTVGRSSVNSDSDEAGLVVKHALAAKEVPRNWDGKWIIDSGATSHICNNKDLFVQLFSLKNPVEIKLGDEHTLKATAQGTVKVTTVYGRDRSRRCSLNEVLYVPELSYNLLSVPKIVERGNKVNFSNSTCFIRDGKQRLIAVGLKQDGLYNISTQQVFANLAQDRISSRHFTNEDLWHYRYGHLSVKNLKKLARDNLVREYNYSPSKEIQFCESCLEGKQHRSPFPTNSSNRANEPLELVHTDVCGKLNVKSLSGSEYFVTFVDDYTRYIWVYILKNKSDVFKRFVEWKAMAEQLIGKSLKVLRSDNGGEYTSTEFEDYLKENGVIHQLTVPKCPEQNGVAERLNRMLMEMVRSMLASSNLPTRFWAEALNTATYLRNRCPTRAIDGKTPSELLSGEKPKVGHLRIFGCAAYCHVPNEERRKLDSKSRKCVFLGYSENRKGYRLYDCTRERVIHSRDVIFDETSHGFEKEQSMVNTSEKQCIRVDLEDNVNDVQESNDIEEVSQGLNEQNPGVEPVSRTRYPTRVRRPPDFFGSYINIAESTTEPLTVKQALGGKDREKWKEAMIAEFSSLKSNDVWELVEPPEDSPVMSCKWVFKRKTGENGLVNRYKARLVAQGYSQRPGIDYEETFSPVVRFESLRVFLALAAQRDLTVHQMDVKTAFLNGELNDVIYMKQPEEFMKKGKEGLVCRLKRSIYGLKQSPRCWNSALDDYLKSMGFIQTKSDPCIYVAEEGEPFMIAIYVDDILLAGRTDDRITHVKKALTNRFDVKDLGRVSCFLGVKMIQDLAKGTIWAGQPTYTKDILNQFNMRDAKAARTPVNTALKLTKAEDHSESVDQEMYQSAVGKLLYLSTRTRPDIAFAVSKIARYTSKPTLEHWKAVKHIFRYLAGTINYGIVFKRVNSSECTGYSDADWGGDLDDRKSTSGYIYQIGGGPVSWSSRKQSSVALSTTEAEYVALASSSQEAIWLRELISELTKTPHERITINEDNQSAICLSKNPQYHGRSKHVSIKHHFIRDHVKEGLIEVKYCRTEDMIADMLTKGLSGERLTKLRKMANICELPK